VAPAGPDIQEFRGEDEMMELTVVKKKIQFVSPDKEDNQDLYNRIQIKDDCFGMGYLEGDKYCIQCVVLAELEGRREPLSTFCKEMTGFLELVKEPESKSEVKLKAKGVTKTMKKEGNIGSVTGTSELIRAMLAEGKSQEEIVAALTPMFVEKGATVALAKKRIRPLIYRALKKGGKPAIAETM
jgi:hypothetical protein